ncbi:hypothetical protein [Thetidibacter halocola]|uniref:Uncharacterized protein n=1 Tax=Thetidibacter halocola TaxID=2827239 RepID=A0A8J8B7D6_9RHOB|nr:hypothetical protein [Thetidibacter halocola]MBS0124996.1 hypothetical protein [Thetidibacter halocola]
MSNESWRLESFIDSLVVELDQARETLAVKSMNRPLSYAVKDLSLDLQVFPTFDGDDVRFRTAEPQQEGFSTITLQLASITDQQIRATSKPPPARGELQLESAPIDDESRRKLKRLGVRSVDDIERLEQRNVDLKSASGGTVDYSNLANMIRQARRGKTPPQVRSASVEPGDNGPVLRIEGDNLCISDEHEPVAVVNAQLGEVLSYGPDRIDVRVHRDVLARAMSDVILTLDPYCIARFRIDNPEVFDA